MPNYHIPIISHWQQSNCIYIDTVPHIKLLSELSNTYTESISNRVGCGKFGRKLQVNKQARDFHLIAFIHRGISQPFVYTS